MSLKRTALLAGAAGLFLLVGPAPAASASGCTPSVSYGLPTITVHQFPPLGSYTIDPSTTYVHVDCVNS